MTQLRFPIGSRPTARPCTCRPHALTPTELAIVAGIASGLSLTQIGQVVHHTDTTVATYIARARRKLGARNRGHLVALALRDQLIGFDPDGRVVVVEQRGSAAA